jgi:hypothetical protein
MLAAMCGEGKRPDSGGAGVLVDGPVVTGA